MKLKPLNNSWAFALAGTPGESIKFNLTRLINPFMFGKLSTNKIIRFLLSDRSHTYIHLCVTLLHFIV